MPPNRGFVKVPPAIRLRNSNDALPPSTGEENHLWAYNIIQGDMRFIERSETDEQACFESGCVCGLVIGLCAGWDAIHHGGSSATGGPPGPGTDTCG